MEQDTTDSGGKLVGLAKEHSRISGKASRLQHCLQEQVESLVEKHGITLGVPIEARVKSWTSIREKIGRKSLDISSVLDLDDFIGLRIITLFAKDASKLCSLISENFTIISEEDAANRLEETQFGYQSFHFIVSLPKNWLSLPRYADLGDLRAEIQVRTLAQHIWAAASHSFQYKREDSVPGPLRRSIYRISALLETIDLEFTRLLAERGSYINEDPASRQIETLNVDNMRIIMDSTLPPENRRDFEDYDDLLSDLAELGIASTDRLVSLLEKQLRAVLEYDRSLRLSQLRESDPNAVSTGEGGYLTQSGLVRVAATYEFGSDITWKIYSRRSDL